MKQCVLVLEFGKNVYNDNLVEYLKPKYIVKRYDLFQDKNIKNHDFHIKPTQSCKIMILI